MRRIPATRSAMWCVAGGADCAATGLARTSPSRRDRSRTGRARIGPIMYAPRSRHYRDELPEARAGWRPPRVLWQAVTTFMRTFTCAALTAILLLGASSRPYGAPPPRATEGPAIRLVLLIAVD